MNATNSIISILSAMGATPTATTDENGNAKIKVNAPEIIRQEDHKSNV